MSYNKQIWSDGNPAYPLSADRLSHIEDGINNAATTADSAAAVAAAAQTAAASAGVDTVKSAAGVGGLVLVREGIDTPTGAANEVLLSSNGVAGGSASSFAPPGLDIDGGQIGTSLGDPSNITWPASTTETDAFGNLVSMTQNVRQAVRVYLYSNRIDKVSWYVLDGSTAALAGQLAIVHPTSGNILASTVSVNLSPATVVAGSSSAPGGGVMTWTLATPLTNLTLTSVIFIFQPTAVGTLRIAARGATGMTSPTALRTSGSLHRSGQITATGNMSGTVDITSAAAWAKKPVPNVIMMRTS